MKATWKNHKGEILSSIASSDVIECEVCGFSHIIPIRDEKEHLAFYKEKFYEKKENYISSHIKDLDWWTIENNEKYDFFEKHLETQSPKRIFDIGSGPGFFLKIGKERGWEVTGIEPGIKAYRFSTEELGLNVYNDFFLRKNYKNFGVFDVIHMNNVLEHIANPYSMLQLASQILDSSGLLCVTVPNDFNSLQIIAAQLLKKDPWWVSPTEHYNYFCMDSLSRLIQSAGFEIIHQTASFPLEMFLLMGDDYIGDSEVGQKVHSKRKKFDLAMAEAGMTELKRKIYSKLAEIGLGRQITVIGKKL